MAEVEKCGDEEDKRTKNQGEEGEEQQRTKPKAAPATGSSCSL